ncbi:MAG: competence/damage-inducible protein A [Thermodesulfobacteriota bacterium]
MIAEILSTGDEIRTGALTDTNAGYLARHLEGIGLDVVRHHCVGDDADTLQSMLTEIGGRADICLITGGLGPTEDDITAPAAAAASGTELELDAEALNSIEDFFSSRKLEMPPSNKKQALLPRGAEALYNPVGTAPGFAVTIGRCRCFFMPGVPFEMRRMLSDQVLPRLENLMAGARTFHRVRTISTFGLTESATGDRLTGLVDAFPDLKLGMQVRFPEIHVKLYAAGSEEAVIDQRLDKATGWVRERLGKKIFSISEESMEAVVGELLRKAGATVAAAESCTGGLLAHRLTEVSGSSDYFLFSGVTYANEAKIKVLGVQTETLADHGAVSIETAREMAEGVRNLTGADYGISTTGIAGPTGGTDEKPVGTVCIGLASRSGVEGRKFTFQFPRRSMNKRIFATTALDLLRKALLQEANR